MTRRVAILGLGARGTYWAETFHRSGWAVSGFDPDPIAGRRLARMSDWTRETTISATVKKADWVFCCLPERVELMQMVLKRAQAEAPAGAVVAVATRQHDIETVQACAMRPSQVVLVALTDEGSLALNLSEKNSAELRAAAKDGLAELAAVLSADAGPDAADDQDRDVESA